MIFFPFFEGIFISNFGSAFGLIFRRAMLATLSSWWQIAFIVINNAKLTTVNHFLISFRINSFPCTSYFFRKICSFKIF